MRVRASARAAASIREAIAYYRSRNPQSADAFRADVQACRQTLAQYPGLGVPTSDAAVRAILTVRFSYVVYFRIDDETLFLIDVRHPARERLFGDEPKESSRED